MQEIWKDIKGYEGLYQISNLGRVKSLKRIEKFYHNKEDKILKAAKCGNCYLKVILCKNNIKRNLMIHRLVAETFISNPENKVTVNHIDGNKHNNCVDNLEWNSYSENIKHAYKLGLNYGSDKMKGRTGKFCKTSKAVYQIDKTTNKILNEYYSLRETEKATGIKAQSIINCCKRKIKHKKNGQKWLPKTAGGFIWRYKEEYDREMNM